MLRQGSFLFYSNGVNLILPKGVSPACPKGSIPRAFSTRLNSPSVILRHKHGWFFLTVAPTRFKVSFTSRHTRLLLYRLLLIADVPAVSRPGVSAEIPDLSRYSSLVVGAGGVEPSDLGLSVPALTAWRYSRLKPLSGSGLSCPWAMCSLLSSRYGWFDFGGGYFSGKISFSSNAIA